MKLARKGTHRGVIGVESAIVMIAFVIVAAALAFVVLNMGFSTTQKTKASIATSVDEASSSLVIAGKVTGSASVSENKMNVTAIPLKVASGGNSINLNTANTAVRFISPTVEYGNIYTHVISSGAYSNLENAMQKAVSDGKLTTNPVNQTAATEDTQAILFFTVNNNDNFILDKGEHAFVAIVYKSSERPASLDLIRSEIIIPAGSPLTIERTVPNLTSAIVDLG